MVPEESRHRIQEDRRSHRLVALRSPFVTVPLAGSPGGLDFGRETEVLDFGREAEGPDFGREADGSGARFEADVPADRKETPIMTQGLVQAQNGIRLYREPAPNSEKSPTIYSQNTSVILLSASANRGEAGWIKIMVPGMRTGWIEERYIARFPADEKLRAVTRKFYVVAPGDRLEPLVVQNYPEYDLKEGDDLRTIVQAFSILNKDNTAVYYDDNKSDNAWFRDHIFDRGMSEPRQIYARIGVRANRLVYFPSMSYIAFLKSEHALGERSAWENTAIEYGEKVVGFLEGLHEGFLESAGGALKDVVTGLWDQLKSIFMPNMVNKVEELYKHVRDLDLTDLGKNILKLIKKIVGDKFAEIEKDLNKKNALKQYHSIGKLVGWLVFEIAIFVLTDGAAAEEQVAAKMEEIRALLKESETLAKWVEEMKPALDAAKKVQKVQGYLDTLNGLFDAIESIQSMDASAVEFPLPQGQAKEAAWEMNEGFAAGWPAMEFDQPKTGLDTMTGDNAEAYIRQWLSDGAPELKKAGLPLLDHWIPGQYNNSRHGIDIIGFSVSNNKLTLAIIEVKGGVRPELKERVRHGIQMGDDWVENAVRGALENEELFKQLQDSFHFYKGRKLAKEEMRALLMAGERHVIVSRKSMATYLADIKKVLKRLKGKVKMTQLELEQEAGAGMDDKQVLDPNKNKLATRRNQQSMSSWPVNVGMLMALMGRWVDLAKLQKLLKDFNAANPGNEYALAAAPYKDVDAFFTECVHQFQLTHYINPAEQDGVLGPSTLDTLGLFNHKPAVALDRRRMPGQAVLDGLGADIAASTGNEFTAVNWFDHIVYPSFLGVKIADGVHLLLWRKLKAAEDWILALPAYKNMTAAGAGKTLGFTAGTRFSAGRFYAAKQAMHSVGLAIDIEPDMNPWVGAGWLVKPGNYDQLSADDKHRWDVALTEPSLLLQALSAASGEHLTGGIVNTWLDSLAVSHGMDTLACYTIIKQKNDEFVHWLAQNPAQLAFWRASVTFNSGTAANGFLHLHPDLVVALRQTEGLAWGAIDFGPSRFGSGDMMHFDLRTQGVGRKLAHAMGGAIPAKGHHPGAE